MEMQINFKGTYNFITKFSTFAGQICEWSKQ